MRDKHLGAGCPPTLIWIMVFLQVGLEVTLPSESVHTFSRLWVYFPKGCADFHAVTPAGGWGFAGFFVFQEKLGQEPAAGPGNCVGTGPCAPSSGPDSDPTAPSSGRRQKGMSQVHGFALVHNRRVQGF